MGRWQQLLQQLQLARDLCIAAVRSTVMTKTTAAGTTKMALHNAEREFFLFRRRNALQPFRAGCWRRALAGKLVVASAVLLLVVVDGVEVVVEQKAALLLLLLLLLLLRRRLPHPRSR